MRPPLAIAGRLAVAYLLLATFWASAPMRATAFVWVSGPGTGAWMSAPALLGVLGLDAIPGALWSLAAWCFGSSDSLTNT